MQRRQNAEAANGLVTAARVQAAGFVAVTGMHLSSMLSREAEFQANGDPRAAERLNYIADSFAEYAAWEVPETRAVSHPGSGWEKSEVRAVLYMPVGFWLRFASASITLE